MHLLSKTKLKDGLNTMLENSIKIQGSDMISTDWIKAMKKNLDAGIYDQYHSASDLYEMFDRENQAENEDDDEDDCNICNNAECVNCIEGHCNQNRSEVCYDRKIL
jgi:hypothetical protein